MPTSTFDNLKEDKKRRILEAAVEEFSERRFSEASINSIVKSSGISRGSFYQYFADKEDLYLYVLRMIGQEKLESLTSDGAMDPDDDFFTAYRKLFVAGLEWAGRKPKYSKIGYLMKLDDSDFITKLKGLTNQAQAMLAGILDRDKQRGLVREDVDPMLVVEMIQSAFNTDNVLAQFRSGSIEGLLGRLDSMLDIVKGGIRVVQGR